MQESVEAYLDKLPLSSEDKRRILITIGCRDCDPIPKVPGAGDIFTEGAQRYQLMHNGVKVLEDCYYGRWMTEIIRILRGHHEPQEERVFHALLDHIPDGGVMLELGSYWGYYSLWFQRRIRGAVNYLVEPDPSNMDVGKRNFALNQATGSFFQYAVGRYSSEREPFTCVDSDHQEVLIPRITVDNFLALNRIQRVDLLLADIQGAELEMLQGAAQALASGRIRFLVLSTHHHCISRDPLTHQECLRFLKDCGAHLIAHHTVAESHSGDGLIVASLFPADRNIGPVEISKNWASNNLFRELEFDLHDLLLEIQTQRSHIENLEERIRSQQSHLGNLAARNARIEHILGHPVIGLPYRAVRVLARMWRRLKSPI